MKIALGLIAIMFCTSCTFDDIISIKSGDNQEEVVDRKDESWKLGVNQRQYPKRGREKRWWDYPEKK